MFFFHQNKGFYCIFRQIKGFKGFNAKYSFLKVLNAPLGGGGGGGGGAANDLRSRVER